ncbi:MAG TPA: hypothetical protein VLG13_00805 [Patescibacteria group bacterium]|nr:hypothetical protein [Patescibacteria group bacterium]
MSEKTIKTNPITEEAVNLRQAHIAIENERKGRKAAATRRNARTPRNMEEVLGGPLLDLEDGVANIRLGIKQRLAERAVKKHYQENNGAYQDAAVAEAQHQGVHIIIEQPDDAAQQVPVHVAEQAGK